MKRAQELSTRGLDAARGPEGLWIAEGEQVGDLFLRATKPPRYPSRTRRLCKANKAAWEFFEAQPPSYRKIAFWWVVSAKKEETRLRLDKLIESQRSGSG